MGNTYEDRLETIHKAEENMQRLQVLFDTMKAKHNLALSMIPLAAAISLAPVSIAVLSGLNPNAHRGKE